MKYMTDPLERAIWLVQQRWRIAGCLQLLRGAGHA